MPLLLWLIITAIVYVATFKDDFTKEYIEKASPFLVVIAFIGLVLGILTNL